MNYDNTITFKNNPYEKILPNYFQLAKEKYDSVDLMMKWLGLNEEDLGELCKGISCSEEGTIYNILVNEYESIIETKFIKEL